MTSIVKKIIKGNAYFYLVESKRVGGKPRYTNQIYLGSANKIKELYALKENKDIKVLSMSFGSVACILSVAEELKLDEIIRKIVPDNNYKLSIYQHSVMQSIARFNESQSKADSVKWFNNSILPMIWNKDFSSPQTVFNQFDKLIKGTTNKIPLIEEEICKSLLDKDIKPSTLIWDPTNFFTYIEEGEELPRKGASKEKRYDKNIINLGMVISDENIPLMHTTYEGNKRESDVMSEVVDTIHSRLQKLGAKTEEIVFVFDRGNNSEENIKNFNQKLHFIGALKKNQLPHLYNVNLTKFETLYKTKNETIIKGFSTNETVYDEERKIVVTYSEATAKKQKEKTEESVKKIKEKFQELEQRIKSPNKKKKTQTQGISKTINLFLHKQYSTLFSWEFDKEKQILSWKFNEETFKIREKTYGKTIIFTDLKEWTAEKIAKTYNSKTIIEDDFKTLKNKLLIPVKPIYSRLDNRLKAHIFVCVLSLIMYRYMIRKLKQLELSESRIVEEIKNMRIAFIKQENSNSIKKVMETMTKEQIQIYNTLKLERFLPQ
jgi:transposase